MKEHHCEEPHKQPHLIEIEKFHESWEIRFNNKRMIVDISFCPYCGEKLK